MRAIIECQPYRLPAAYFEEWKYFEPVFTERRHEDSRVAWPIGKQKSSDNDRHE